MSRWLRWNLIAVAVLSILGSSDLQALTVEVKDSDGNLVSGFRWLVEEDTTYPVNLGVHDAASLGVNIHKSYAPVVAKGTSAGSSVVVNVPDDKRYMVSVLPLEGHALGGANVAVGQDEVTVVVNRLPLPTAQISIYVFHDNQPLNNAPDLPAEGGLAGFSIMITDAGGQMMMDAFGNMIGTTYRKNKDGSFTLDAEGNPVVDELGTGIVTTDANGQALVKYLAPGKYGVHAIPPPGETDWIQTTTIEGSPTIDAWVEAGEPPYWSEWGFISWHVWFGFVRPKTLPAIAGPSGTITGQVVYTHDNHPPLAPGLWPGRPADNAWVGLNDLNAADELICAQPCGPDGQFTIENVPPGTYQLVMWDLALDGIIDFRTLIIPAEGGLIDVGKAPIFGWFGHFEGTVFIDSNDNGYRDDGEPGLPNQGVTIRFPDGTIYQATSTDPTGEYSFDEVFPFFFGLVVEVDFARYKATGATIVVDDGGELPYEGAKNNPQPQPDINPNTGDNLSRTEVGETLTQSMLLYAGQTSEVHWGKKAYDPGQNGGISGIVYYATTRAEDDPRFAAGEEWEPGIPRVQVNLYEDQNPGGVPDGVIDDLDGDGGPTLADVDNYPFGWKDDPLQIGDEDVDRNGNGSFDPGDAINITWTDSWDDNLPDGVGDPQYVHGELIVSGAETLQTWNQVRPGVFDGGYAFSSYFPGGIASGSGEVDRLPAGYYIVEAATPPRYEIVKEEDKNVDFGDQYIPHEDAAAMQALVQALGESIPPTLHDPPIPVGDDHLVPAELTLFPGVEAPYAGQMRPLADRKLVRLTDAKNAAADFFVFTEVPKAGRIWGVVFNDALLEFNPDSVNKGTNLAPAWMPVAIRDFQGNEVARVYTDEWGRYNALIPSTFTVNIASPSGVSPNMLTAVINDPGPIPDPNHPGEFMIDPRYDPGYNQLRWTFDSWPGKTTRLDTPVLPIAAFRGNRKPLDCQFPDGTPAIFSVSGPYGGPYVKNALEQIAIQSVGEREVPNPDYDPEIPGSTPTITRDYGFGGTEGSVTVNGVALEILAWAADGSSITAKVPESVETGQLMVTREDNGKTTMVGVTLHVGDKKVVHIVPGASIQEAIDSASAKTLILVAPGTYKENLFLWKHVKLQGWGAFSTNIEAGPLSPAEQLAWDAKLQDLISTNKITLIPGERADFYLERAPGILVVARNNTFGLSRKPLIDGLTITRAIRGGAILANAYADYLQISNNVLMSNQGSFGGGIRIGTPSLVNGKGTGYLSSNNPNISIHHNLISQNGAVHGGGGLAIFNGADGYSITDNMICGNFSFLYGGGIAHFGLSDGCLIAHNKIFNNESFDEGGGMIVAGELVPAGAPAGTLTEGAGSVTIDANLIQGNLSGDDGGGIRALMVNGQDVEKKPNTMSQWHALRIFNNVIVNNSSADAGGGISLDDAARVYIINNIVAHNDSTSTGADAFGGPIDEDTLPPDLAAILPPEAGEPGFLGGLTSSVPQVAGIATKAHSAGLQGAFGAGVAQEFSNPVLVNNIIWQNRSFFWDAHYNADWGGLRPDVPGTEAPVYWDLAVYGTAGFEVMDPRNSILTDTTIYYPGGSTGQYHPSNISADPAFLDPYVNVFQATSKGAAFGNFVSVTFEPTGLRGDYHIGSGSPAVDIGTATYMIEFVELGNDYDSNPRPLGAGIDAGADEVE